MFNLCTTNFIEHHKNKVIRTNWQNSIYWFVGFIFLVSFSACKVAQSVSDGEHLLENNRIKYAKKIKGVNINKEDIPGLIIQKPNTKMFGLIALRLGIYNLAYDKKENKFRWWLKNKLGEAPVIYKEAISSKSSENIRRYLFNEGFLNSQVSYTHSFSPKKVVVNYKVFAGAQFTIGKIILPDTTNSLLEHVKQVQENTIIASNNPFSINTLDDERARITTHLRNMGYYNFRKDYIIFDLDTNNISKKVDIVMSIKGPSPESWHLKYTINNIYVLTDNLEVQDAGTLSDTVTYNGIYFVGTVEKYKPKIIANGIFLEKDQYFRLDSYQSTLRKLANYGTFKFVDIQFKPLMKDGNNYLDAFIYLTSSKKQVISVDLEARHNFIGLAGASAGVTYQNKNFSRAADMFEFKVSSGIEFNAGNGQTTLVNNADVIVETNYYLNRFLVPFPLKKTSKYNNVKTRFSLQYNYERRIQFYSLHSNTFNFGYEWNESANKKHIYNPISATVFFLPEKNVSADFRDRINEIPSLARSFEEQLILGSNYTFFYNNKKSESDRSYVLFKGNIALAGNLIHGIVALSKQAKNNPTPYSLFNQEYSQFARFEANLIHNFSIGKHSSLNSRFNTGVIVPFGNSTVAPYFQQFYVGGSNSIRAFRLRALGPGTYADEANIDNPNFFFDQAGDFKIEGNAELRFDIYKFFKGALFVDAGNVWLLKQDPDREGGTLRKGNFLNAIAVGTGFGLRLDFDYFVIRTDFALPLIDPRFDDSRKYPLNDFKLSFGKESWFRKNSIFHLAIGYPF